MTTTKTFSMHTVYIDDRELNIRFEPEGYNLKPIVKALENAVLVGYLARDTDCCNPLEDGDGDGRIYDRRRGSCSESKEAFNEAMGIDQYGEHHPERRNPLAVLLDVYSHSGECWSIHGEGMNDRWDTSSGAGVWIPDECCVEHIKAEALRKLLPGLNVAYKNVSNPDGTAKTRKPRKGETPYFKDGTVAIKKYSNNITWTLANGYSRGGYKNFKTAYQAAAKYMGIKLDKAALAVEERKVAVECAKQALQTYNTWLSGDCWGICVELFNAAGERIKEEACWGYIGQEYAEEELKGSFAYEEKTWAKENAEQIAKLEEIAELGHS